MVGSFTPDFGHFHQLALGNSKRYFQMSLPPQLNQSEVKADVSRANPGIGSYPIIPIFSIVIWSAVAVFIGHTPVQLKNAAISSQP